MVMKVGADLWHDRPRFRLCILTCSVKLTFVFVSCRLSGSISIIWSERRRMCSSFSDWWHLACPGTKSHRIWCEESVFKIFLLSHILVLSRTWLTRFQDKIYSWLTLLFGIWPLQIRWISQRGTRVGCHLARPPSMTNGSVLSARLFQTPLKAHTGYL